MPKVFTSTKQKIGKLGEELAKKYLIGHGYTILDENYTKKYGEIDLVAQKDSKIHFIEVKSLVLRVSHETVTRETSYDPLQNIHPMKLKRLSRVIQVYLLNLDKSIDLSRMQETQWQFDVITVKINQIDKIGTVKHIKEIII